MTYVKKRIIFDQYKHLQGYLDTYPQLRDVLADLVRELPGNVVKITSLNRTREEDNRLSASGIHSSGPPWRACDVSYLVNAVGTRLTQYQADLAAAQVNSNWSYDPNRPGKYKVIYCAPHGTAPHFHLQVHPNTERV